MAIITLCTLLISQCHKDSVCTVQMATCIDVATEAVGAGVDPALAASLGWHETRLRPGLTSKAGAKGPLQAIPRFWCKSEPCNYTKAGLRALKHYMNKEPTVTRAICRYNAGTCIPKAWEFAESVVRLRDQTRKIMETNEQHSQSEQ